MNIPEDLKPGDLIGYYDNTFIEKAEDWKTLGRAAHIETFVGIVDGVPTTITAKIQTGVNYYQFHSDGIVWIRRPNRSFDVDKAKVGVAQYIGKPYGWQDIFANVWIKIKIGSVDCSHISALFVEAGGAPQFDTSYDKTKISPRDFEISFESVEIYTA